MPRARHDLAEALQLIASESPDAAERTRQRLITVIQYLVAGDLTGPQVTLSDGRIAHRWSVRPYWIYYRFRGRRMEVLRIYHQARRPIER